MHRSRLFRRRCSLPFVCGDGNLRGRHPNSKLLKGSSIGSMINIYDEESVSSTSSEDSSSCGSDATNRQVHGECGYLSSYPWYIGKLNRLVAEQYLEGMRDGTYLVRQSQSNSDYTHAICVRWRSTSFHVRLYTSAGMYSISNDHSIQFRSIEELVAHFQEHSLVCKYPAIDTNLKHPYREELARIELEALSCEDYEDELPEGSSQTPTREDVIVDPSVPLVDQPWYHQKLSRRDSETLLADQPGFSFLLRDSESTSSGYSLSIRDENRGFLHLKISQQNGGFVLGQYSHPFNSVPECIAFYSKQKLNIKDTVHQPLQNPVTRC